MTDRLTPDQRHICMSHIHSKDTKPELKVRQWLWAHGYRYRLNVKTVPGKPDIVMRKYRTAIFVNGCFWHGHGVEWSEMPPPPLGAPLPEGGELKSSKCCKIPQTNREFWVAKIQRNQERDQQNYKVLEENGWQVIVVWECELTTSRLERTMREVEVLLHDFYLKTFNYRAKTYIHIEEEPLPMAAEEPEGYGLNL
jgi:DNA mismatch endonuclease (patch repair protein)